MQLSDCVSLMKINGVWSRPEVVPAGPGRITVTVDEGLFVFLPGNYRAPGETPKKDEQQQAGRFVFKRRRHDGEYATNTSKPPGRLTWRRKARYAQSSKRGS